MCESSSSDGSDHPERSRNVRGLLVKSEESQRDVDENYAYKQKLGDLRFDASFEGGNLGDVKQLNRYEYDLIVRPDVTNPRHSVWFNFTISNQRPNQCIILNFINLSDKLSLFNEIGLTPVARSRLEPNWVRLRKDQVFYYRAADRDNRYILSIAFRFTFHDNEHQFALFYPYTFTTLDCFITRWVVHLKRCEMRLHASKGRLERPKFCPDVPEVSTSHKTGARIGSTTPSGSGSRSGTPNGSRRQPLGGVSGMNPIADLKVDTLTSSVLSKPIYELTVLSRDLSQRRKPVVIVIGRPAGNMESVSSLVCQGLLDFMLSDDPIATVARDHLDLVVFPMLDPDSSWVGNSRTDLMGQRTIDSKTIAANPSIYQNFRLAMERISSICAASRNSVVILELRANSDLIGSRVVGTLYADSMRMEKHLQLPRLLSRFADGFYLEKCKFAHSEDVRENLFKSGLDLRSCTTEYYQLEVSPFGYHKRSLVDELYEEYDQLKYLLLGKSIGYALIVGLRQKDKHLPATVREHLKMFQPTPKDIDDLVLFQS